MASRKKFKVDGKDSMFHTQGIAECTWKNGRRYVGNYENSHRHGQGVLYRADGSVTYEGSWLYGRMDGTGTWHRNGWIFHGSFSNGRLETCKELTSPKGDRYLGDFWHKYLQGLVHESFRYYWPPPAPAIRGEAIFSNGGRFVGEYQGGELQGKYKLANGNEIDGIWWRQLKRCQGTLTFVDGSIYSGVHQYLLPYGWGLLHLVDGSQYQGNFRDGHFDGFGELTLKPGAFYAGFFKHNVKHGQGQETFLDGATYIGGFREGHFDGHAMYLFPNNDRFVGQFENGIACSGGLFLSSAGEVLPTVDPNTHVFNSPSPVPLPNYDDPATLRLAKPPQLPKPDGEATATSASATVPLKTVIVTDI